MNNFIFHQLFEKESSTYTYLIADPETKDAIIIDPVLEMVQRDYLLINELELNLKYILETHVHADHISASDQLRKLTGAKVGLSHAYATSCPDIALKDGQELQAGAITVQALSTPGHTNGCMTYKIGNMIFTGDVLLIRGCGRTDFQGGSSEKLYSSVREKLFQLGDNVYVYPAHDYKGFTHTTIGYEKKYNPRLNENISKQQFKDIMSNLHLDFPKKIQEAVPANMNCGKTDVVKNVDGIPTVSSESLHANMKRYKIIDVRGRNEFIGELKHIPEAVLATLGTELDQKLNSLNKEENMIFVCRSGKRSAEAVKQAIKFGMKHVYNLEGGMLRWNELNYPTSA